MILLQITQNSTIEQLFFYLLIGAIVTFISIFIHNFFKRKESKDAKDTEQDNRLMVLELKLSENFQKDAERESKNEKNFEKEINELEAKTEKEFSEINKRLDKIETNMLTILQDTSSVKTYLLELLTNSINKK
jgi:uncharacterized protein YlxW (UPF0749 family)